MTSQRITRCSFELECLSNLLMSLGTHTHPHPQHTISTHSFTPYRHRTSIFVYLFSHTKPNPKKIIRMSRNELVVEFKDQAKTVSCSPRKAVVRTKDKEFHAAQDDSMVWQSCKACAKFVSKCQWSWVWLEGGKEQFDNHVKEQKGK